MLISISLKGGKFITIRFKNFPPPHTPKVIGKLLCASVEEPLTLYITFSVSFILYQVLIASINFKTFEEYLRESVHRYRQTVKPNAYFQLSWKVLKKKAGYSDSLKNHMRI